MTKPIVVLALPWYSERNYQRLMKIFTDATLLPPTFEKWQKLAEQNFQTEIAKGRTAIKVDIDPDTFSEWCRLGGVDADAKARIRFAGFEAQRIVTEMQKR
ncbi:MAG: hypothetical protein ACRYF5_06165 [Janthinobacterium lividum]